MTDSPIFKVIASGRGILNPNGPRLNEVTETLHSLSLIRLISSFASDLKVIADNYHCEQDDPVILTPLADSVNLLTFHRNGYKFQL